MWTKIRNTGLLLPLLMAVNAAAQQPPAQAPAGQAQTATPEPANMDRLRTNYVLGPNDQILIRSINVDEINEKPFRVEEDGQVNLPLIGKVQAGGLSVREFEADLIKRLGVYIRNPQVAITIVQFRSEPVWFVGAFAKPGIYPLQGRRTLVEMLASIGGLQANASRRIKLTRRKESGPIPLPNAIESEDGLESSVEISMGSLSENINPAEDIALQPYDRITVERAELVYINGEVGKVGGFDLGERESVSVLQLITMAGGLNKDAAPEKARLLRPVLNTSRRATIPLNVKNIVAGTATDYPLLPNDVLFIPRSRSTKAILGKGGLILLPLIPTIILLATQL